MRPGGISVASPIAGATSIGARLVERIEAMPQAGNVVVGFYDDRTPTRLAAKHLAGKRLRGGLQELVDAARRGRVDVVHIALPLRAERRIRQIITALADTTATVNVATDLFIFDLMQARWDSVGDIPVVSVFDTPFEGLGGWVKRAEDVILASIILCLIALPMAVIAVEVKLPPRARCFPAEPLRPQRTADPGIEVPHDDDHGRRPRGRSGQQERCPDHAFRGLPAAHLARRTAPIHQRAARGHVRRGSEAPCRRPQRAVPGSNSWLHASPQGKTRYYRMGAGQWLAGETEVLSKMESRVEHDLYYIDNWSLLWDLQIVFLTIFGRRVRSKRASEGRTFEQEPHRSESVLRQ